MSDEKEFDNGDEEIELARAEAEGAIPGGEPPTAPEPAGAPQPVAQKSGCGCTGTAIALLLAGGVGLFILPAVVSTNTMGATRSARIERESRAADIERAWAENHPDAQPGAAEVPHPEPQP